jgi:hypothetical protein
MCIIISGEKFSFFFFNTKSDHFWQQCDVLPGNASNNLWVTDFISQFIGYTPSGITINDNTLNITLLQCEFNLVITLQIFTGWPPAFFCHYYSLLTNSVNHSLDFTCLDLKTVFILACTKLNCTGWLLSCHLLVQLVVFKIIPLHRSHGKHSPYCCLGVLTEALLRNGSHNTVILLLMGRTAQKSQFPSSVSTIPLLSVYRAVA